MNESAFTRSVNRGLPKDVYAWKTSDRYTAGIPDCWYSGSRGDLWVEWKYLKKLTNTVLPALSAHQTRWLNERHAQGRNVAVIVGSPQGCIIFTKGDWTERKDASSPLTREETRRWISDQVSK